MFLIKDSLLKAKLRANTNNQSNSPPDQCQPHCHCHLSRRTLLKSIVASMIGCTIMPPIAQAAENNQTKNNQAKALVFSCIDFRFLATERYFLSMKNLGNSYDWATLAGGSLALAGFPNSADTQTFWDQLEFSYKQHNIKRVLILDHENCDAYAVKFSPEVLNNKQQELQLHTEYLRQAYWSINTRYPDLNVELYFVTLNNAEVLSISPT
jgi:hypothetical protein